MIFNLSSNICLIISSSIVLGTPMRICDVMVSTSWHFFVEYCAPHCAEVSCCLLQALLWFFRESHNCRSSDCTTGLCVDVIESPGAWHTKVALTGDLEFGEVVLFLNRLQCCAQLDWVKGGVFINVCLHEHESLHQLLVKSPVRGLGSFHWNGKAHHTSLYSISFSSTISLPTISVNVAFFFSELGVCPSLPFLALPFVQLGFNPLGLSGVSSIFSRSANPLCESLLSDFDFFCPMASLPLVLYLFFFELMPHFPAFFASWPHWSGSPPWKEEAFVLLPPKRIKGHSSLHCVTSSQCSVLSLLYWVPWYPLLPLPVSWWYRRFFVPICFCSLGHLPPSVCVVPLILHRHPCSLSPHW